MRCNAVDLPTPDEDVPRRQECRLLAVEHTARMDQGNAAIAWCLCGRRCDEECEQQRLQSHIRLHQTDASIAFFELRSRFSVLAAHHPRGKQVKHCRSTRPLRLYRLEVSVKAPRAYAAASAERMSVSGHSRSQVDAFLALLKTACCSHGTFCCQSGTASAAWFPKLPVEV